MNRRGFLGGTTGLSAIAAFAGVQTDAYQEREFDSRRLRLFGIRERDVTLSTEQLLTLTSTPVPIIPAPPEDRIILPIWGIAHYLAGPVPFTVDGGNDYITIAPAANPDSNFEFYTYVGGLLDQVTDSIEMLASNAGYGSSPLSEVIGQAFVVGADIPSGKPWIGGDGSLKIRVGYIIV